MTEPIKSTSIIIEIIDEGQVHIYDNHVGVLSNSPHFPWH